MSRKGRGPDRRGELLRRFFSGITEHAFQVRLGVTDPPLIDYISELLIRFIRSENIYSIRSPNGERLRQVVDMLTEAQQREGAAKRHVHRHIGDFTLFWTGVYPEVVESMRRRGSKDSLIDYSAQGKRAYYIASTIPVAKEVAPSDVLERLSEQFELCAYGLAEVRRQWEDRTSDSGPTLLLG